MADVAFMGLGVMGYPMAGHLAAAGHRVTVYNRTVVKAAKWAIEHGGEIGATPAEAAAGAEFIFCCVGADDDVRAVVTAPEGALEGMAAGSVLVDHTTASPRLARELAEACAAQDCGFLDAPVSGGQAGAENGALTVMCGGAPDVFERVNPVVDCYSRAVSLLGPAGSGQLTKAVNQLCIAGIVQGLSEGVHFAEKAGLDPLAVIGAISTGAAGSWQMDNRAETMVQGKFDYGFAVEWMRKDLGIALDEARSNGAHLPLAALVDQFYSEVTALGGRRWDTSSLVVRLRAMAAAAGGEHEG